MKKILMIFSIALIPFGAAAEQSLALSGKNWLVYNGELKGELSETYTAVTTESGYLELVDEGGYSECEWGDSETEIIVTDEDGNLAPGNSSSRFELAANKKWILRLRMYDLPKVKNCQISYFFETKWEKF